MTRSQNRLNARPRGATGRVLDFTKHEADALAYANEHRDPTTEPYTHARVDQPPYVLAVAADGSEWLIGEEGVGWALVEEDNEFGVFLSRRTADGTSFSMFPQVQVSLTRDEVLASATDEYVDLADHIRVFGQRLDDNHRTWFHRLTKGE